MNMSRKYKIFGIVCGILTIGFMFVIYSTAIQFYELGRGLAFLEFRDIVDADGNKIDRNTAITAAKITGLKYAAGMSLSLVFSFITLTFVVGYAFGLSYLTILRTLTIGIALIGVSALSSSVALSYNAYTSWEGSVGLGLLQSLLLVIVVAIIWGVRRIRLKVLARKPKKNDHPRGQSDKTDK